MFDKILVYIKKTDESFVPVTVRIEWLADGKIKPYLYWTPDGSCYEVKHIYETTPLALLKNRGEGLRFKVMSEAKDMEYLNYHTARHETYLYLADNFFCGKNIIDSRYNYEGKKFIPVTLDVFPNCKYELISFKVHEQEYTVERTIAVEPCGSYNAGGVGIRHKVDVINSCANGTFLKNTTRIASLYFEINKWFVNILPASP
jgi:hypothetical protein